MQHFCWRDYIEHQYFRYDPKIIFRTTLHRPGNISRVMRNVIVHHLEQIIFDQLSSQI